MKKLIAFLACLALFVPFAISSEMEDYYSYSYARLSYVKGDVYMQRAEDLGYEEGVVNLPVVEGDKLGTREGRAEIHFGKRNYLRIDNHTQIDFADLPERGDDQIKLHLLSGSIFLRINFLEKEKSFEIHTPDASFYILEEGLYRFDVRENTETELHVYEGTVEAAGEEGSLLVREEERIVTSNGHFNSDPVPFYTSYEDNLSRWNRSREALHNRIVTQRYLPAELDEYEVELAYNGRWVYERPYGHVWVPYAYYHDWRPYYYGRWAWYPIIGWTWVSYDPWGWCVYRYGRWHWRTSLGWYWIPHRRWGPAWVHWHWGYDYIGWCPLSYYGYPGVIIDNYFYGRYYGRYYPVNSRALTVIRKSQLQARRISRVALSHDKVTKLGKISLSAKQPGIRPAVNRGSAKNSVAARVLSRSGLRQVGKSYVSGKSLSSRASSGISGNNRSRSSVKTYPSRGTSSSISRSRSFSSSSSKKKSSVSHKNVRSYSDRTTSFKANSSRSKIKTYSRSRKSPSLKSSSSTLRKRNTAPSSKSAESKTSSTVKRYSSRKSYTSSQYRSSRSSVRQGSKSAIKNSSRFGSTSSRSSKYPSYKAPQRSYSGSKSSSSRYSSSPSRKISSPQRYSSRSFKSSSSRTSVSRSSSRHSTSSRSSSSKKIKKK